MDAVNECRHRNGYGPPIIKSAYSDSLCVRTLEKDKYGTFVVKNYEKYYDIPESFRESHNQYCLEKNINNEFIE
jgi:ribosomal protein S24E